MTAQLGYITTFSEPAITEDILFELAMLNNPNITLLKTKQSDEYKTGTDWEFWIGRNSRWVRYAIQAKKLDLKTGKYNSLYHKVHKIQKLQTAILREYAEKNEAVPLYCFYNYLDGGILEDAYPKYCHKLCPCCHRNYETQFGITVTPLSVVEPLMTPKNAKNRTFEWIHMKRETIPWHFLVCCDSDILSRSFTSEPKIYDSRPIFDIEKDSDDKLFRLVDSNSFINLKNLYKPEFGLPRNIAIIDLSEKG